MNEQNPKAPREGAMFRLNYLRPAAPQEDSPRARLRLSRLFEKAVGDDRQIEFKDAVEEFIGTEYPSNGWGYLHRQFWEDAELGDILSAITIAYHAASNAKDFLSTTRRIFHEEHLRYRIDDKGGVHYLVDEEFERNVVTTLAGLGTPQFANARRSFEEALTNLGAIQQSGKGLIRGIFEAVESAFLVVIAQPNVNRLNKQSLETYLRPLLLQRYADVGGADDTVDRMLAGLAAWVNSAHPYRHGTPLEQIHEAPLDLAILSASQGIAFLRYLAAVHTEEP